jgi:propane monooxygenase reductase subunit
MKQPSNSTPMTTHTVSLQPVGEEFECGEEETVLDAAFRNGYNLVHGCREGRCTACKSMLLDGYVDLKPYSTFALSESEEEAGYTLLCRAVPESDIVVELLHYDPDNYKLDNPIVDGQGRISAIEELTHDISRLEVEVPEGEFGFTSGQYVDLWVPESDEKRSYSMAHLPGTGRLDFIIKRYPGGVFSGLIGDQLKVGDEIRFTGPYGNCVLDHAVGARDCLLIAGGSGMAPMLSLLRELVASETLSPAVTFFYGGRAPRDLFYVELIEELGAQLEHFQFIPVLSDLPDTEEWDGERGFIHEAVDRYLEQPSSRPAAEAQIYMAGPQVMIDATFGVLTTRHGVDADRIAFDTFG